MLPTKKNPFFNAHHSPIGAFSTLTLGFPGAKGGLGLELGQPADRNFYVGLERSSGEGFDALPFFERTEDDRARYDLQFRAVNDAKDTALEPFSSGSVGRQFGPCIDSWTAGDLQFTIYNPWESVPNPASAPEELLKLASLPAVILELKVDNRQGLRSRRAILGFDASDPYTNMRPVSEECGTSQFGLVGVAQGTRVGILTNDRRVKATVGWTPQLILADQHPENRRAFLGNSGLLVAEIPAGTEATLVFAACFFRDGQATAGIRTTYWYNRYFQDLEAVAAFAMDSAAGLMERARQGEVRWAEAGLSEDQAFMGAHAIRAYYGSTQWLEDSDGKPIWVVNEGEYRMMNTLDLTVDHLFFELAMNPWTVGNVCDLFLDRYSYRDQVRFPKSNFFFPGGLTFTHDMGTTNCFGGPGHSSYEHYGLTGCFSHMSHEQLVNWLCCALAYGQTPEGKPWLAKRAEILADCLQSLLNRDNPDPSLRKGIMGLDSQRVKGGSEITTYDSLDESLGQARNNVYLAGKCWAVYVGLEKAFRDLGQPVLADVARDQAQRSATTLAESLSAEGFIPAVIGEGIDSRIIPAIEGLVFPEFFGSPPATDPEGSYGPYIRALKTHFESVLKTGYCLFPDGGWKLSSTSVNSWLSKIYLCQYVARVILQVDGPSVTEKADQAHIGWLLDPVLSYWSWSDQILDGKIHGSKYYPRGVTAILWVREKQLRGRSNLSGILADAV